MSFGVTEQAQIMMHEAASGMWQPRTGCDICKQGR